MLISVLQPYIDNHALAGAVTAVASKDRVLDVGAIGFADIAAGRPMARDSLFWIASMSKPITGTALMMLVESGDVRLDDPVETYLPEFTNIWLAVERDDDHVLLRRPHRPVSVRDTICHVSGLPFIAYVENPTMDRLPLCTAVRSYAITPLQTEPGTRFEYSNAGINIAGRIVEAVSGRAYETFLDERIFGPLGMRDTTFWPTPAQLQRLALAYRPNEAGTDIEPVRIAQLSYPLDDRTRTPLAAGGLFSTAADMARFGMAILRGGELDGRRILQESTVRDMLTRQTQAYPDVKDIWALSWWSDGVKAGHGGALSTNLELDPTTGLVYVYLVQHAGFIHDGGNGWPTFRAAADTQFEKR